MKRVNESVEEEAENGTGYMAHDEECKADDYDTDDDCSDDKSKARRKRRGNKMAKRLTKGAIVF